MSTAKYVLFAALGAGAVILLTSEKARDVREGIEDNARQLRRRLRGIGRDANATIDDLKKLLDYEIDGLTDDARRRIEHILAGATNTDGQVKKNMAKEML